MNSSPRFSFSCLALLAALIAPSALRANDTSTHAENGYTLTFNSEDPTLDAKLKERMVKTFFTVYPVEARDYNPAAARTVTFSVETGYHGIAATAGGTVHFSADYLHKHPQDIDVITHETMHVVQAYPGGAPGWLVEGIADYARYKYGVDNADGGWSLPDYAPNQKYTDAYRVTARFLVWLEKNGHPNLVKTLDSAMRTHTYTSETWQQAAGKTVDELWQDYAQHPAL